jgi:hypothetical protein
LWFTGDDRDTVAAALHALHGNERPNIHSHLHGLRSRRFFLAPAILLLIHRNNIISIAPPRHQRRDRSHKQYHNTPRFAFFSSTFSNEKKKQPLRKP